MIRLAAVFWIALVALTGFGMFKVKYGVQSLEDELNRVRKQTLAEQQEIRVLNAEWSYLTQPERLSELNRRFLTLAPIPTKDYQQSLAELPRRPISAPAEDMFALDTPGAASSAAVAAPAVPAPAPAVAAAAPAAAPATVPAAAVAVVAEAASDSLARLISEAAAEPARTAARSGPVLLVKVSAGAKGPHSLDELFSQINEGR